MELYRKFFTILIAVIIVKLSTILFVGVLVSVNKLGIGMALLLGSLLLLNCVIVCFRFVRYKNANWPLVVPFFILGVVVLLARPQL